jgi:hypothetical protein
MTNPTGAGMVRVTRHPKDPAWLLLKTRPEMASMMGTLGPATYANDLHAYVMHADQMDTLRSWARFNGVPILNEVRDPKDPLQPLECGNVVEWITKDGHDTTEDDPNAVEVRCCAPYRHDNIPRICGACGQPANPIVFEDAEPPIGTRCPDCAKIVRGGAKWCIHCGAKMPHRHLRPPAIVADRVKGEPRPITVDDMVAAVEAHGNVKPPWFDAYMAACEDARRLGLPQPDVDEFRRGRTPTRRAFGHHDWAAYRAFWTTMGAKRTSPTIDHGGVRPDIHQWDAAGRPATWNEYLEQPA